MTSPDLPPSGDNFPPSGAASRWSFLRRLIRSNPAPASTHPSSPDESDIYEKTPGSLLGDIADSQIPRVYEPAPPLPAPRPPKRSILNPALTLDHEDRNAHVYDEISTKFGISRAYERTPYEHQYDEIPPRSTFATPTEPPDPAQSPKSLKSIELPQSPDSPNSPSPFQNGLPGEEDPYLELVHDSSSGASDQAPKLTSAAATNPEGGNKGARKFTNKDSANSLGSTTDSYSGAASPQSDTPRSADATFAANTMATSPSGDAVMVYDYERTCRKLAARCARSCA